MAKKAKKAKFKKKIIYRTMVQVEVLSEEPIGSMTLEQIQNECEDGAFLGGPITITSQKKLFGKKAVKAIEKVGSDSEFFQIDTDGNIIDEDSF